MKRFFTFLMAVWALLSISQTVKAADVTVYFQCPDGFDTPVHVYAYGDGGAELSGWSEAPSCSEYSTSTGVKLWKYSFDSKFNKVIFKNNSGNLKYPSSGEGFPVVDNHVYTSAGDQGTLSEFENGGTTPSKFTPLYIYGNFVGDGWDEPDGTRPFTTTDGKIYQYVFGTDITNAFSNNTKDFNFRVKTESKQYAPQTNDDPVGTEYTSAKESSEGAWKLTMTKGKSYTLIFDYENMQIKYSEQGSGSVIPPTPSTNPIAKRKYSEGYYLVGNFFNFDGDTINYKDAVFKFKQQKDGAEGNDVYMLEIPATLTARAQVMSVDATGTPVAVYGPGEVLPINNSTLPVGADSQTATTEIKDLKSNIKIEDGTNYWDMTTRRTKRDGVGQDGSYKYYITVDPTTGEPIKWEIKYTDLKRVAYLLSTNPLGSALTVGSTRAKNTFEGHNDKNQANFNSGKYFGSLYMDNDDEYYGVSNDLASNNSLSSSYGYEAIENDIDRPTYNKLFLFGNGGLDINQSDEAKKAAANWGTFKCPATSGVYVLEFNTNKGNGNNEAAHGGTGAEILKVTNREVITTLSMVGPAIPGTTTGNKWDWASPVADMDFDVSENCYKLTIATTEENRNKVFRFVGNHTQKINWFENSNVDQKEMAAKYNDDGKFGIGHTASPSDPNEVSYTQNGLDKTDKSNEDNLDIIWNRPAGTWTVRFHIYTYSQDGNNPSYRYFYTINKNSNLELRDFKDVVYMSEENVRNIKNRGNYQYFRTWSDDTAWKRPKNVDVFVVSKVTPADETHNVGFELTKINNFDPSEDVIPAKTGVILALKENVDVPGAVFHKRKSLITYNTLDIQLEQAKNKYLSYTGEGKTSLLIPCVKAKNIPTQEGDKVNYLFGFYHAIHGLGLDNASDKQGYNQNDYLLGFWISNGNGMFYSNSCYLQIAKDTAEKLNLGTNNNTFDNIPTNPQGVRLIPALLHDFANIDSDVTGIKDVVNNGKLSDGKYYTLSGQQVEHPTAGGIYIHNGKKYIVK